MKYNILKNKIYLYLTEFFSGMAIMAVELGASRLLAPYFSSSQIVWTIIIATIMIAMAAGNVYGGRSADKHPDPDILYRRFLIAEVWIAAIPVLGKYVILLISGALIITISHHLLVIAAFLACMIIFVYPCFLMGTVTPSLVKYTVDSLEESGTTVGTLGAFAFWEDDLTYEGESIYNYLQVRENDRRVILSTNVLFGVQSVMEKQDGLTGMYYDYAMAAPVMAAAQDDAKAGQPVSILILGMGSGTYDHQCRSYFRDLDIKGVEIDEKITDLAHQYFALPEDANVTTYDGRAYLAADHEKYDVIMVDAYQDITIPFQMSSAEFFSMVRGHLTDNGVMVVNMNMRSDADDGINTCLADTIASVFPQVKTIDVPGNTNRILVAGREFAGREAFAKAIDTLSTDDPVKKSTIKTFLMGTYAGLADYRAGRHILTDDKAPVELLGMRAIDQLVSEELAVYKEMYHEQGMQGIMEELL